MQHLAFHTNRANSESFCSIYSPPRTALGWRSRPTSPSQNMRWSHPSTQTEAEVRRELVELYGSVDIIPS